MVFSPFSLHTTLAVLVSGATENSTTQKEILGALGRVQNIQALEEHYGCLLDDYLKDDVKEILSFGIRFWTSKKYFNDINQKFISNILEPTYEASFKVLKDEEPEVEINDWVKKATKGKIDQIVDSVDPETAFLIASSLYFKAAWTVQFEDVAELQNFTLDTDEKILTKMIRRTSFHNIAAKFETDLRKGQRYTVVAIPYEVIYLFVTL